MGSRLPQGSVVECNLEWRMRHFSIITNWRDKALEGLVRIM
jgi:hypothetical protein